MKKITMYKANSGKPYETEQEALLDDAKSELEQIIGNIKRMDSDSETIAEGLIENGDRVVELLSQIKISSKALKNR